MADSSGLVGAGLELEAKVGCGGFGVVTGVGEVGVACPEEFWRRVDLPK